MDLPSMMSKASYAAMQKEHTLKQMPLVNHLARRGKMLVDATDDGNCLYHAGPKCRNCVRKLFGIKIFASELALGTCRIKNITRHTCCQRILQLMAATMVSLRFSSPTLNRRPMSVLGYWYKSWVVKSGCMCHVWTVSIVVRLERKGSSHRFIWAVSLDFIM